MPAALTFPRHSPPGPRQLQRCLLLAVLLHVWLVLVFGNATGTAAPGQGVWGNLTVKLLGRSGGDAGAPPGEPAKEWRDNGAVGQGTAQRQGGQVRPEAPAATTPGAAELGRWNPREVAPEAAQTDEISTAAPSTATLDLPPGFKPIERENLAAPPTRQAPLPEALRDLPAPVGRLEARPEAVVTALPAPASLRTPARTGELPPLSNDLPPAINRLDATPAPARTSDLPQPAQLRAASPSTTLPSTDLPPLVRRLESATAVRAALPRPSDLRAATNVTTPPLPADTALPSPVQWLGTTGAQNSRVTPLNRADALRAATPTPAAELPSAQDLPAPVSRLAPADSAARVTRLQQAATAGTALAAPGVATLPELSRPLPTGPGPASTATVNTAADTPAHTPAGPARGDPAADLAATRADPFAAAKASAGSPDAGSRLGADVAVAPSAAASAPRAPLNLSLPRGGDIAARRGPGLIDLLPQPPERKSKLEQAIEDTTNKDCRKAYANAGILAALPLALDAARGKGCKW